MRLMNVAIASLVTVMAGATYAQDWIGFTERTERFFVNFPSQPKVETFPYESEYGFTVSGKKYTATRGEAVYSVTVINFATSPEFNDLKGAVAFAAHKMRTAHTTGKITFDAYAHIDKIDGIQIQVTEADGRRFFGAINMHMQDKRLYILEATVPRGAPPPAAFQVSLQILDEQGNVIRYQDDGVTRARGATPAGGG